MTDLLQQLERGQYALLELKSKIHADLSAYTAFCLSFGRPEPYNIAHLNLRSVEHQRSDNLDKAAMGQRPHIDQLNLHVETDVHQTQHCLADLRSAFTTWEILIPSLWWPGGPNKFRCQI